MKRNYFAGFWIGLLLTALVIPAMSQDEFAWNFNEGSGTIVKDDSGQYAASLGDVRIGVSDEAESPSGLAGDRSVWPAGGLQVVDSENPVLALQNGPVTIEAWIKPVNLGGYMDIARIGNSIKVGFNAGNMVFTFLGIVDVNTEVAVPVDKAWHHVAYAWEPGVGVHFFLDGQELAFVENTDMPGDFQNNEMSIGSDHAGNSNYSGLLDRFRLHNAVLTADQLDSDPATVAPVLDTTIVAYNFDEDASPYASSTVNALPAVEMNPDVKNIAPSFSSDTPTGEANDYSLSFDGNDRVMYDDNDSFFFDFIDESFTFQSWIKFNALDQVASRPVLFGYGVGGQGGYSFSFRPAAPSVSVDDSPSQAAGDLSIQPHKGLAATGDFSNLQSGPVTLETWVKMDNPLPATTDVMRIGNSIKAGFFNNTPVFTLLGVVDVRTDFDVPSDGAWHHLAYAWDPGVGVTFYLDGQEAQFVEATGAAREFSEDGLSVGAAHNGSYGFAGSMDRFRVHNAVLTPDQLDSDAANPKAISNDIVAAYNFDEGSVPYQNAGSADLPISDISDQNLLTVTTYGIVDAHSNAVIPEDGKWHQVAAVFDYDAMQFLFYVDGQLSDTMDYDQGVLPAPADMAYLYMGCEANGGAPYVGLLDRVKITRGALTQADLDYFEPVPVAEWSLY